ncbi:Bifunctional protein FolC [uncultured Desulfatiglans sp.]|nr:Bifunctional protein FolC [uncultured Desulfatiglans sp.]
MQPSSYQEALGSLYRLQKFGIKFGLSQTAHLLEAFGNPHLGERYVHIAGTNGKGSVSVFLAAILEEAGYRVGFYSSPHLVRFTERFRINGEEMSPQEAVSLIRETLGAIVPEEPPTFFEAVTAMALVYFKRRQTDLAILEVGMGGRLDATNLVTPFVSAITNISLEHQAYLGRTLRQIAWEKAGIIKPGVPVFTAAQQPAVLSVFEGIAREKGAPLYRIGKEIRYRKTPRGLNFYGRFQSLRDLQLGLRGCYQSRNAALALALAEELRETGWAVSEEHMRRGLQKAFWPGRMHVVSEEPVIVLDGAHNPAAMRHLAAAVQSEFPGRRLILVIGIMEDKDIPGVLSGILPISSYVIYTRPVYARAADPKQLMSAAGTHAPPGETVGSIPEAIARARSLAGKEDVILICGSLFTVGEALVVFDPLRNQPDPP